MRRIAIGGDWEGESVVYYSFTVRCEISNMGGEASELTFLGRKKHRRSERERERELLPVGPSSSREGEVYEANRPHLSRTAEEKARKVRRGALLPAGRGYGLSLSGATLRQSTW